jgi:hypothetical protein
MVGGTQLGLGIACGVLEWVMGCTHKYHASVRHVCVCVCVCVCAHARPWIRLEMHVGPCTRALWHTSGKSQAQTHLRCIHTRLLTRVLPRPASAQRCEGRGGGQQEGTQAVHQHTGAAQEQWGPGHHLGPGVQPRDWPCRRKSGHACGAAAEPPARCRLVLHLLFPSVPLECCSVCFLGSDLDACAGRLPS